MLAEVDATGSVSVERRHALTRFRAKRAASFGGFECTDCSGHAAAPHKAIVKTRGAILAKLQRWPRMEDYA
ncbi:hypothetical protein CWB41_12065 [Methylovirgula ligni]|nr:hypothetical protein CWB41_12065 [Methylovirgula ligni]